MALATSVDTMDSSWDSRADTPIDGPPTSATVIRRRGASAGRGRRRDPNDLVNLTGRLDGNDRPHIFNVSGTYEIPTIEVQVSGNLTLTTGVRTARNSRCGCAGLRNVFFEAPGSYRRPNQQWLHVRVSKILFRRGPRSVELGGEIRNALQETDIDSLVTQVYASPNFGRASAYAIRASSCSACGGISDHGRDTRCGTCSSCASPSR